MTQILTAITEDYALLASDRRLTFAAGPRRGELFDDNTCKLVSLCQSCCIGYSGLAHLEGQPTHEWIASVLAAAKCSDAKTATEVLTASATRALAKEPVTIRRQIFVMTGFAQFVGMEGLRPHFTVVTNMLDDSGGVVGSSRDRFDNRVRALRNSERLLWFSAGHPLRADRATQLERNLRRLVDREISARAALRLLVDEIVHTSVHEHCATVGRKVLAVCVARRSAERTDGWHIIASRPDENSTTFAYFDPDYSELKQYGPTVTCGGFAATDFETEDDQATQSQSSQFRILALPKRDL